MKGARFAARVTMRPIGWLVAASMMCIGAGADAQLGDLWNKLKPTAGSGSQTTSSAAQKAEDDKVAASLKTGSATGAPTAKDSRAATRTGDIVPDRQCNRPDEKFDVFAKAADYGGSEAESRLHQIIETDARFDALTDQDKKMLRFIALTTVWVPVELEDRIVAVSDVFASKKGGGDEVDALNLEQVEAQLTRVRAAVPDFPGQIRVGIDPDIPDGAFARFGGDIFISRNFAEKMNAHKAGGVFVLSHEMSHIYKRHPIKNLQFKLISTREGWELGKKLMVRSTAKTGANVLAEAKFFAVDVPRIHSVIKSMHLTFEREQELEADACTVIWMSRVGDRPIVAWQDFVHNFAGNDLAKTAYGETHPATAERSANFVAKAEGRTSPSSPNQQDKAPSVKPTKTN